MNLEQAKKRILNHMGGSGPLGVHKARLPDAEEHILLRARWGQWKPLEGTTYNALKELIKDGIVKRAAIDAYRLVHDEEYLRDELDDRTRIAQEKRTRKGQRIQAQEKIDDLKQEAKKQAQEKGFISEEGTWTVEHAGDILGTFQDKKKARSVARRELKLGRKPLHILDDKGNIVNTYQ